ncbi:unnamed protein product [Moneuplotes crassus]|uniref:Transmembrane protein n=1 Tax=Euplotes crassus TaxID=5936 RepID=A0AAD1Y0W5_EUPCR|nr:unnamed protein product [Moneuplotes crassus]
MFKETEEDDYNVTLEQNEKINETVQKIKESIKDEPEFYQSLIDKYDLDIDVFFDPQHDDFEEKYAVPDPNKDNILQMIAFKYVSRGILITGAWILYSITRLGLRRYGYFPTIMKKTRYLSIPVYCGLIFFCQRGYSQEHTSRGLTEYKCKRSTFEYHTKVMKSLLRGQIESVNTESQNNQKSIKIKEIANRQK